MTRARRFLLVLVLVAAAAPAMAQDCSPIGQNSFIRDVMNEFYFWYREMPSVSPASFDSPQAYLDAVRFRPLDTSFSHIAEKAATEAFFSNSQFVGIGFSQTQVGEEMRITQVFPGSPAEEIDMRRGDYLVAVNGRRVSDLLQSGELGTELGPSTIGFTLELTIRHRDEEFTDTVVKRPVTIPTVSQTAVFDVNGLPVGYVHFRNFVEPSVDALNAAFTEFRARGVTDLIVDLRYNGGGLVSVAQHLGSLIGGFRTITQVFAERVHNDRQSERNVTTRFEAKDAAVNVPRVVFITTRSSASSSELVINGLEPFLPVTLVGANTFGKPVGQYGFEFCDQIFFPVSFKSVNAAGFGEYFGGLPADCPMHDGLDRPLAHPEEAMLAEALTYLRTGACTPPPEEEPQTALGPEGIRRFEPTGFQRLVGAW